MEARGVLFLVHLLKHKLQPSLNSRSFFFALCYKTQCSWKRIYQLLKPFHVDMEMCHNKTSSTICEEQNTGKSQPNLNPVKILCRLRGTPQSPRILMQGSAFCVPCRREARPSHTWFLTGCSDLHHCLGRMDVGWRDGA